MGAIGQGLIQGICIATKTRRGSKISPVAINTGMNWVMELHILLEGREVFEFLVPQAGKQWRKKISLPSKSN